MRLRISMGRARPLVRPSIRPSARLSARPFLPIYVQTSNMAVFEGEKSSTDIVNNGTMSYHEVVESDVPPRYLFLSFPSLPL